MKSSSNRIDTTRMRIEESGVYIPQKLPDTIPECNVVAKL